MRWASRRAAPAGVPQALVVYPSESGNLERTPLVVRHRDGSSCAGLTVLGVPIPAILDELDAPDGGQPRIEATGEAVMAAARAAATTVGAGSQSRTT
jgi:hypothetical protein